MNQSKDSDSISVSSDQESVTVSNVVTQSDPIHQVMPAEVSPTNINEIDVTIPEVTTNNGLMTELQNLLSIVCYEAVNKKTMKTKELITKMYEQLFSNSTRMGYAEQLIRGEGHFAQLYEKVPVETHGINNNNTNTRC